MSEEDTGGPSGETPGEDGTFWVDANVLLRFLTGEPPELAGRAQDFLESAGRGEVSVRVHPVVVAETVWVLESFYGHPRERIASSLAALLEGPALAVENKRVTLRALETMATENVDLADALISETACARGEAVASFDRKDFRKLARRTGLRWREPGG
ncbi:MAG: PIN domain-containing protein [Rubrobacter sp.]|nr:PIN domain-containing protein [Rubrobacter sp.]